MTDRPSDGPIRFRFMRDRVCREGDRRQNDGTRSRTAYSLSPGKKPRQYYMVRNTIERWESHVSPAFRRTRKCSGYTVRRTTLDFKLQNFSSRSHRLFCQCIDNIAPENFDN